MWPIGLCVVALATIFITHWIYKWRNPKCNGVLPPGSMGIPLIGETLELLIPSHSLDLHPFIKKRIQKYGPVFRTNLLGRPVVITADPQLNNYIFQQEGKLVELWYMDSFDKVFGLEGEARPNAVGHIHKYVRGVYLGLFGVESLRTKLLSEIEQTVRTNLHTWSTQGTIDTKKSVASMVAIFAAKCQFGHDFENSADDVTETIYGFVHSLMSFPLNIPGTRFHKCMKDKEKLQEVIRAKLKEKLSNPNPQGGADFLDHAVKDLNTDFFLTEDFFVYATIGALFATVESISSAITLSFKLFAEHPWVVEDLAAEHEAILKRRENKDSPLTWDEYKSMTATMHVVNEVIRLGNVLPGIFRKALKDIQYNGYTIPAGWAIMAVTQTLQLNPKIFKDPLAFNPRRWKDIDAETASKNFMPFGGGQRQCAGAELAKAFFATFLHVLVTEYRWTKVKGGNVARSPMLRFEEDLIIQVSKKHIEALPKAKCTST